MRAARLQDGRSKTEQRRSLRRTEEIPAGCCGVSLSSGRQSLVGTARSAEASGAVAGRSGAELVQSRDAFVTDRAQAVRFPGLPSLGVGCSLEQPACSKARPHSPTARSGSPRARPDSPTARPGTPAVRALPTPPGDELPRPDRPPPPHPEGAPTPQLAGSHGLRAHPDQPGRRRPQPQPSNQSNPPSRGATR